MNTLKEILQLDNQFRKTDNQIIIDNDLDLFQNFSNSRDQLIAKLKTEFKLNKHTEEEKQLIIRELQNSNLEIATKFNEIKKTINKNDIRTQQFKHAYRDTPTINGSFFVDKTV